MNKTLQVNLKYTQEKNKNASGIRNLKNNHTCSVTHVDNLIKDVNNVIRYFDKLEIKLINGFLVDVNYVDLIPKSSRIKSLLKPKQADIFDSIVGVRFSEDNKENEKHVITYYIDRETIKDAVTKLEAVKEFLTKELDGTATPENFNIELTEKRKNLKYYNSKGFSKSAIRDLVVDCSVINSLSYPHNIISEKRKDLLISLYKTEKKTDEILFDLNIDINKYIYSSYGDNTLSVSWELFEKLKEEAPYLIAMISSDLSKIKPLKTVQKEREEILIPKPLNEPTIGVIDMLFDESVYFSDWVDNNVYLKDFEKNENPNRDHGTAVTSLIVDGPTLNPDLQDNCGRFKARHFGVCEDYISIPSLVRKIRKIINENKDIHVWNLSLGTSDEVSKNYISYDSSVLDEIQNEYNVIFVISGTNDDRDEKKETLRIGSPADSLNSVVVNSVRMDGSDVSYARKGPVLSFFNKPDVSYYGGDYDERINVYTSNGIQKEYGTSFAAPWIARKLCYLIDVIGLQKEVAKALLIDSAANWRYKTEGWKHVETQGYGVVPIDINDIINTDDSEIRFVLYGTSQSYKTTNYSMPIPKDKDDKYPFVARATLCYFPECTRTQGVDYTNRELSLRIGRIKNNGSIDDINRNAQDTSGSHVTERESRSSFRKWDNTKFISGILKDNKPLRSYDNGFWGLDITSKERRDTATERKPLNFGIVVTLKEIYNKNRIQDFIKSFQLKGIIVNEIDIKQKVDLYLASQSEIEFKEE